LNCNNRRPGARKSGVWRRVRPRLTLGSGRIDLGKIVFPNIHRLRLGGGAIELFGRFCVVVVVAATTFGSFAPHVLSSVVRAIVFEGKFIGQRVASPTELRVQFFSG
jgi:hypothetical protein